MPNDYIVAPTSALSSSAAKAASTKSAPSPSFDVEAPDSVSQSPHSSPGAIFCGEFSSHASKPRSLSGFAVRSVDNSMLSELENGDCPIVNIGPKTAGTLFTWTDPSATAISFDPESNWIVPPCSKVRDETLFNENARPEPSESTPPEDICVK